MSAAASVDILSLVIFDTIAVAAAGWPVAPVCKPIDDPQC